MRKKVVALLLCGAFTASVLTGCGSAKEETNAGASVENSAQEEETEADGNEGAANEDVSEDTESVETETPDVVLTGDTEITDADLQELYTFIAKSVESEYLEPNGIAAADFSWPAADSAVWGDYSDRSLMLVGYDAATMSEFGAEKFLQDGMAMYDGQYPSPDKEILDAVMVGIFDWMETKGNYDEEYFANVFGRLIPMENVIPANVTIE